MTPSAHAVPSSRGELRGSIAAPDGGRLLEKLFVFFGPGYLVATGYMDPGNWATALAAGSRFGAALLFVAVISSLMAIVLQSLSIRLGLGAGLDLAQACRAHTSRPVAIGLQLLFGLPLALGILVTAFDTFLILAFERLGFRKIELFVVAMLGLIGFSFAAQLVIAQPDMADVARGLIPTTRFFTDPQMLYLGLGVLGATVMPHNLFLHSFLVQTRAVGVSVEKKCEAIRFAMLDSALALFFALLINGAILILAASVFHAHGLTEVAELGEAHRLIAPLLGEPMAATLFAVALIACGLNSTITATLAGQIVMEGFIRLRLSPATRRLTTRALAIAPAIGVTLSAGESATARLLVLSQVALSVALPFAVIPLVIFTARREVMGALIAPRATTCLAAVIATSVIALNLKLLWDALAP